MTGLWEMAFGTRDHQPGEWQGATVIDHAQHQRNTAATDGTAIHNQNQRLTGQGRQNQLGERQQVGSIAALLVLNPPMKLLDPAGRLGALAGCLAGNLGQLRVLGSDDTTDQGCQGIEMLLAMTTPVRWQCLQQRLFYGTIPAIRVAHSGFS